MRTRILIADDSPIFRKALRQLLEGVHQWEVIEACDGQEAVHKSVDVRPNLVLLDLAMPVKDGLAAAREISEALPDTPILMCTMHVAPNLELEAKKSGVRAVLSKSESGVLVAAVQALTANQPVPEVPASDLTLPSVLPCTPSASSSPPQPTDTLDPPLAPSAGGPENVS